MSTRLAKLGRSAFLVAGAWALAVLPVPAARADAPIPVTPKAAPAPPVGDTGAQAARFVQSYARASQYKFIIRWRTRLCIEVRGLPPEQDAAVKSRIQAVAQSMTLWLYSSRQNCGKARNVSVVFTDDPQHTLDEIIARDPLTLGDQHSSTRSVKTVTRPIQAWYQMGLCGDVCGPKPVHEQLATAMVLVDMRRAGHTKLATIADYVTMLVLSEPQFPDRCQALPSVLDLFAGPCHGAAAPTGLTRTDLAYLKAAYTADEPIWRPPLTRARSAAPTVSQVSDRMGRLLSGAGSMPSPGAAPVPSY
jgi:hypothetical protein